MRSEKYLLVGLATLVLLSCASIEKSAVRSLGDMLAGEGGATAFTSDDDPQLIADALPLALKLYEILLERDPENDALRAATGRTFVMYSGAFVQMPAERLPDEAWEEGEIARIRAKNLFRRGRDYLLEALDQRYQGFTALFDVGRYDEALALLNPEDADDAYWAALGWLGMAITDPFDIELAGTLDRPVAILYRVLELGDENAALHDTLIQIQAGLPSSIIVTARDRSASTASFMDRYYRAAGIGEEPRDRAEFHFQRAVAITEGGDPAPYISLAMAVAVKDQDARRFLDLLGEALVIDPEDNPDTRLMVIIHQDRARWLRNNIEYYFLVDLEDLS